MLVPTIFCLLRFFSASFTCTWEYLYLFWFVSIQGVAIFLTWRNKVVGLCLYIFVLFSQENTSRKKKYIFPLNFFSSFSYKKIFFESKSICVQKVWGYFRWTRLEPTGFQILGEEHNQIFLPVQYDLFLS